MSFFGANPFTSTLEGIWDMPMVAQLAFHPRPAQAEYLGATSGPIRDGSFDVSEGESVCYRLFMPADTVRVNVIVYHFHGNAEICTDAECVAEPFHRFGAALLSIDYRGYGWSTGTPSLKKLCGDAEACFAASGELLKAAGCGLARRVMWGRSIGATCAVHLAANYAAEVHGLIVESGLMVIKELPMVGQFIAQAGEQLLGARAGAVAATVSGGMLALVPEPCGTLDKMPTVTCPTLVMHGDMDEIVPIQQGLNCHEQCGSEQKVLKRWPQAGHNDIPFAHRFEWIAEMSKLISLALDFKNPFPSGTLVEAHSLTAANLNGQQGRVIGPHGERVRVAFPDPIGEKALKPDNLQIVDDPLKRFPAGVMVETHSLSAAHMNGLRGSVVGPQGERIRVSLPDPHGEKALKPDNLRKLSDAETFIAAELASSSII